jgi:peptidoglycan/LPS O-acetylase OafA/YrhL
MQRLQVVSVAERLAATGHRPSGFDYMRLALATAVVGQHSHAISYGIEAVVALVQGTPIRAAFGLILPMFFALSGFLVAGSLERCKTIFSFLSLRVLRIVPALAVEITLSALILGPIFTSQGLGSYFTDPKFTAYFLNIIGVIQYELPAVFQDNPLPKVVNAQLWTIPFELKCYIALTGIALVGLAARRRLLLALMVTVQVAVAIKVLMNPPAPSLWASGNVLGFCFLAGVTLFKWRDKLPWSPGLFVVCAGVTMALLLIPRGDYFIAFPAAYMTVYLGLLNPARQMTVLGGDYSYGLFLYGFPIQQAVAALSPDHEWYWNFLGAMLLAAPIVVGSWWLVEKPALNLRRSVAKVEAFALRFAIVRGHARLMSMGARFGFERRIQKLCSLSGRQLRPLIGLVASRRPHSLTND